MDKYSHPKEEKKQVNLGMSLSEYLRTNYESNFNSIMTIKGFMGNKTPLEFWGWFLEQPGSKETREVKGDSLRWPYADRVVLCAIKFINMPASQQDYIVRARKENIFWRGDDFEMFERIARETFCFFQLPADKKKDYIKNAMRHTSRIAVKRTTSPQA